MVTVSHQAAKAAGQVNNATARLDPEAPLAAPRAEVAPLARPVAKTEVLGRVDEPAALAGNSQAAAEPRDPGLPPAQEALAEVVAQLALAAPPELAAWLARVAGLQREA